MGNEGGAQAQRRQESAHGDATGGWHEAASPFASHPPAPASEAEPARAAHYVDLLVAAALRSSLLGPRFLDNELRAMRRTMWKGNAFQGLSSSSNIQDAAKLPWFRLFMLLLGVVLPYVFGNDVVKIGRLGFPRHDYYRFTVLETRDGNLSPSSSPEIRSFGVDRRLQSYLWHKPIPPARGRMEGTLIGREGPSATYRVLCASHDLGCGPVHDGWYFEAGNATSEHPVRFMLEGSDDLREWTLVGASGMRRIASQMRLTVEQRFDFPEVAGETLSFRFRGEWHQVFYRMGWVEVGLGVLCNLLAALTGRQHLTKRITAVWVVVAIACSCIAVLWASLLRSPPTELDGAGWRETFNHLRLLVQGAWLFFSVVFLDAFMDIAFLVIGVIGFGWDFVLDDDSQEDIVGSKDSIGIWPSAFCVMVSLCFVLLRIVRMVRRAQLVATDNRVYKQAWEDALREPGFIEGLQVLQQQVASIQTRTRGRSAIHLRRKGERVMDVLSDCANRTPVKSLAPACQETPSTGTGQDDADENTSWRKRSLAHLDEEMPTPSASSLWPRIASSKVADSSEAAASFVPEDDLDVLFVQATVLQDKLLGYVVEHARGCWGKFPLQRREPVEIVDRSFPGKLFRQQKQKELIVNQAPAEFVAWDEAASPSDLVLGQVKAARRILEKCNVAYQGHPSRMLDLARQRVVFDTPSSIAEFLWSISEDPNLAVMRVRSNMRVRAPEEGAEGEGGRQGKQNAQRESAYKFVSVNVRIVDEETRRLGSDLHVCEILLELRHFAQVRTAAMHDRYRRRRIMESIVNFWSSTLDWVPRASAGVRSREEARLVQADRARSVDVSGRLCTSTSFDGEQASQRPAPINPIHRYLPGSSPSAASLNDPKVSLVPSPTGGGTAAAPAGEGCACPFRKASGPKGLPRLGRALSDFSTEGRVTPRLSGPFTSGRTTKLGSLSTATDLGGGGGVPDNAGPRPVPGPGRILARRLEAQDPIRTDAEAVLPLACSDDITEEGHSPFPASAAVHEEVRTSWGLGIPGRTFEALEHTTQLAARGLRGHTDDLLKRNDVGLEDASFMSILYTSKPLAYASTKLFWRLIFIGFAVVFLQAIPRRIAQHRSGNQLSPVPRYRSYRLRCIETREGLEALSAGVAAFGLIMDDGESYLGRLPGCAGGGSGSGGGATNESEGMLSVCANVRTAIPEGLDFVDVRVGASYSLFLNRPVGLRGWYMVTGEGRPEDDPARFEVLGSDVEMGNSVFGQEGGSGKGGEDEGWELVGTPVWRSSYLFRFSAVLTSLRTALPADRGALVEYDYTVGVPSFISKIASPCTLSAGLLLYVAFGYMRWPAHAIRGLLVGLLSFYVCALIEVVGNLHLGQWRHAAEVGLGTVGYLFLGFLCFDEQRIRYWLPLSACADFISSLVLDAGVYQADQGVLGASASVGYTLLVFIAIVGVLRTISHYSAKKLVEQDRTRYDALWDTLKAKPRVLEGLQHLDRVISMIGLDERSPCRQLTRQTLDITQQPLGGRRGALARGDGAGAGFHLLPQHAKSEKDLLTRHYEFQQQSAVLGILGRVLLPNKKNVRMPVASLDQLYAQAYIAQGLLIEKAKAWAEQSNGLFRLRHTRSEKMRRVAPQYVPWAEVKGDAEAQKRILWTTVKKKKRALEKVMRSYDNDVSKLTDISRTALVFEAVAEMTLCLGQIAIDSEVYVERIKNRLSPKYDAESSAGYRDLLINLRITTPLAVALGIELHVCEVQLMLKEFADLKHTSGHGNYVKFRNSRAK